MFSSKKTCSLSSIAKDSREFTADFGRVTQKICGNFWKFLPLSNASIRTRVLGKSVSCGAGYGLEIHVCFTFQGHVKGIAWVKKKIEDAYIMVQFCIENAWKMHFRAILHDLGRIHQVYHKRYVYALYLV